MKPAYAFVLLVALLGCARWQVEEAAPAQLIQNEQPRSVRVLLQNGSVLLVADPKVEGDAITGVIRLMDSGPGPLKDLPVTVPLSDVTSVSVARVDTRKTLMIVVPAVLALGIVAAVASQ